MGEGHPHRLMARLWERVRAFAEDRLLRRVVRNSAYLFISNVIAAVLGIVTANLLGASVFGTLGILTGFVTDVNRLFSFRMNDVVVRYMGEALAQRDKARAAAVVKAAALIEGAASLFAFLALLALAPVGARYFAKDASLTPLFILYGGSILTNLVNETSTGVLQVTGHFRSQALINLAQSVLVALIIVHAALTGGGLLEVLWAYLLGKVILGLGPVGLALYWVGRVLGRDWWRASFALLPPWKELVRFGISTNFSGTINLIARDSEVPLVGFFFGPQIAGYYKIALQVVNLLIMPINPFIGTTYPEITRAWAAREWTRLKNLLRRVSFVAGGWSVLAGAGLALFGEALLFRPIAFFGRTFQVYKAEYLPALPVLMILLVGYGVANTFFWSRLLLLSQSKADQALRISFLAMLGKLALAVLFLPAAGYLMEAVFLSGYFIVSTGWMVVLGLRGLPAAAQDGEAAGED
ncbi:lipopolysaccharide biosynthesis protein [Anaerolinea sp.]|uniref:lipopolysaccharide biosynthesis protein n=1 Tax=Anaerolinea sp. TaxID=1872519 RepID=UPI002ACE2B9F|nr:lipopolysaccharide biosynthesis protein [Anaerolinea sp.]